MEEENIGYIAELRQGTTLNSGKYTIEQKIGQGGFGITYKAVQNGLGRIVCIKEYFIENKCVRNTQARTVVPSGISRELFEKHRLAFVQEAQTLAQLHHPGIVEVIDVFDENSTSYMVMPFVEGQTLQSIVEKRGPLDYSEAINYVAQVTDAIGYIHQRGILHRDIKPDNIIITADYKAILIDFGAARKFQQDKTQSHTVIGTHGYAPIEQWDNVSRKGSYTDIYSIGATMYFILTGERPMEASDRRALLEDMDGNMGGGMPEPKKLNPNIPDEGNRTILKAMQIMPENRHQSVQEFMDDLLNVKPSELVDETKLVVDNSKVKKLWIGFGTAMVVVIIALIIVLTQQPEPKVVIVPPEEEKIETTDFTGTKAGYPMVYVEGGTFTMGTSDIGEDDCPPHLVTLDGYWIGQYEVTQGLWKEIMEDNNPSEHQPLKRPDSTEYTPEERDMFPVENVSYDDIEEFITKLNKRTGQNFALPTEAQWEFAARGGKKSKGGKFANGGDKGPSGIWFKQEHPIMVNVKEVAKPNELGIYHMSGNVAEWCRDYYDMDFYNSCDLTNPVNNEESNAFVIRGGSYKDEEPWMVNVFHRYSDNIKRDDTGFRLIINNSINN